MPLDPFSALSLAAALFQFIDFTAKIVSKGNHLFQSASGILPENESIESAAIRLRDLAGPLQPQTPAVGGYTEDGALKALCGECVNIASQLLDQLDKLKVPGNCNCRRWKSFRQALKSVWSKDTVDGLNKRLKGLDEQLRTHILLLLRYLAFLVILSTFVVIANAFLGCRFEILAIDKTVPFLPSAMSSTQLPKSSPRIKRCTTKRLWDFWARSSTK
jgi:hypothetical protein